MRSKGGIFDGNSDIGDFMIVTFSEKVFSLTIQKCHQNKPSPTPVTNIDVATFDNNNDHSKLFKIAFDPSKLRFMGRLGVRI